MFDLAIKWVKIKANSNYSYMTIKFDCGCRVQLMHDGSCWGFDTLRCMDDSDTHHDAMAAFFRATR